MTEKSYHDLVREAKTRVAEVTAGESMRIRQDHPGTVIVDCREPNEAALGMVPGSVMIPRGILEQNIERVARRDQKVIIYCAGGNRSALAADTLHVFLCLLYIFFILFSLLSVKVLVFER